MHQAFAVVLPYVLDVKTLLVCSTLSQQSQKFVQDAVRLNLAPLVKQLPDFVDRDEPRRHAAWLKLLWLCSMAGPDCVNLDDNTCAILCSLHNLHLDNIKRTKVLKQLLLTTKVFTQAAVQHRPLLIDIVEQSDCSKVDSAVKSVAYNIARSLVDWILPDELAAGINDLMQSTTSVNLPDVLRVITALSNATGNPQLLSLALEHDRDHVHLLHPTTDEDTDKQDTSTTLAGARKPDTTLQQQRRQQPQLCPAAALLKELLGIAVTSSCVEAVDLLCKVPSASRLGVSQVLQLMLSAASRQPLEDDHATAPCIMASLCSLPAAQATQAGSIAAVLRRGIDTRAWHRLLPLLELPSAKQIGAQCLSGLIKVAAAMGAFKVVGELCRLVQGQQLDRRPVVELVKLFMDAYNRQDVFSYNSLPDDWTDIYEGWLSDLEPGEYLTGDDILELLEFVADKGMYSYDIVCWKPAVSQITDIPRLIKLLQAMACSEPAGDRQHHSNLPNDVPAVKQLSAADWYQVLIVALNDGGNMFEGCTDLPGMQQLDAKQVSELVRACVGKQDLNDEVCALLTLPGAELMSAAVIQDLLQRFLQAVPADAGFSRDMQTAPAWFSLLCLSCTAEMPVEVVQQLYDTAMETGLVYVAKILLVNVPQQAEAVRAVTGERLLRGILAAIKRVPGGGDLVLWREEPGLQSLDAGSCAQVVEALLHLAETIDTVGLPGHCHMFFAEELHRNIAVQLLDLVHTVLQVPSCQQLQAPDVLNILKACLRPTGSTGCISNIDRVASKVCQHGLGHIVQSYTGHKCYPYCALMGLLAVTAVPAAAGVNHQQLLELLSAACRAFSSACLWKQLMHLPIAQQLLPAELAAVLSKVVDGSCAEDTFGRARSDVSAVVGVLLQHPVGQQLSVGEVSALLDRVAQQLPRCGLLAVAGQLLQHPVAASMTCDTTCQLLGLFAGVKGASSAVVRLLQLPAAQQLSWDQIKPLLWQCACRCGYRSVCEALCSLPAAAAVRDDPEVQVVLADNGTFWLDEPVHNVVDDDDHVESEWCSCPKCSQIQGP